PIGISSPRVSFQIETTARPTLSSLSSQLAASLRGCWNSNPMPRGLLILTDEKLIDEVVKGTEHAHLIDKDAKGQRGGVLATLSEIGESLKLLPSLDDCSQKFSLTGWTHRR